MGFNFKNNLAFLAAAGLLPFAQAAVPTVEGFSVTWSDDFVGTANSLPNTADWTAMTGTSYPGGAANWGTNEIETVSWSCGHISSLQMWLTLTSHSIPPVPKTWL